MNEEPSPKQTLILWALLAQDGSAPQKELPLTVDKKDRDALVRAGLISVAKGKANALRLEVTDRGWSWAGEHLDAALPPRASKGVSQLLQAWLGKLQGYLRASGASLADILTAQAPEPPPEPEPPTQEPKPQAPSRDRQSTHEALRNRVRGAYMECTGGRFNDAVPLSHIRERLADIERSLLDETLLRMHGEPGATLMNLGNPREIEAEREAKVSVGGKDMHVLWISR